MRLLQIVPLYDSYCVFLRELTQAMLNSGHEVMTLCWTGEGNTIEFDEADSTCRNFPLPRGSNLVRHLRVARSLRKVIEEFEPDVVHAHFSAAILSAALARVKKDKNIRWMGTFQGLQFPYAKGFRGWLTKRAEVFSASRMDQAWVLTQDDAEALCKSAPKANVCVQTSPGFGCADRFVETPILNEEARRLKRAEVGFTDANIVFIFIGRLVDFKGFHLAARAFIRAHRERPEIRWLVIGERDPIHPTSLTDEEWEKFKSHEAITWLRTQADVLPWLDISDAMLFPTTREGMPVSVMEALARQVPVLTNEVRGCRELIENGVNGILLKSSTVAEICKTLVHFRNDIKGKTKFSLSRSEFVREMIQNYSS